VTDVILNASPKLPITIHTHQIQQE